MSSTGRRGFAPRESVLEVEGPFSERRGPIDLIRIASALAVPAAIAVAAVIGVAARAPGIGPRTASGPPARGTSTPATT
ncbi:MAG: hypothetical protein ACREB9_07820, partial [Thermoplasmata archaeon]